LLAQQFKVNRHTIRRSIAELVEEGLLKVEQGRGTFVIDHLVDYQLGRRTRFTETVLKQNKNPIAKTLSITTISADRDIAGSLKIDEKTDVFCLETIREINNRPLAIGSHYFPKQRFPNLIDVFKEERSISGMLSAFGCGDYERYTTKITARPPTRTEASILIQSRNLPILVTESINVDKHKQPIEYGVSRFAADRVQLVVET
ncbi:phosphonate metabolism transcriptional regulator PhnF, partial [Alphaproteobacteria bacterium]|nr:phosphonate metabolism transcriptional regulator PhnF [Alphaproteobacteria bacterium]